MITYKGSRLVKGKNFITESGNKIQYKGKAYGNNYLFESDNIELILTEQEVSKLKDYTVLKEHSLLEEQDNNDDLYQTVTSYTDEQIKILNGPSGKMWKDLKDSFQKEINEFNNQGLSYKVGYNILGSDGKVTESYLLEVIMDYLEESQRNISSISLPNHYVQLSNFIYNIDKLRGDK